MLLKDLLKVAFVVGSVVGIPAKEQLTYKNITAVQDVSGTVKGPIIVYGNKFFDSATGDQFFIKGIAYQPSRIAGDEAFANLDGKKYIDPMSNTDICLRDLPYLVRLGVNTVRVYAINPDKEHDECFDAFAKAGIYVFADLSEPDISVVRESPSWDVVIQERYQKVVDSLHKYDNLLGFFAGNEVTNDVTNTDASPFVKSSIRDVKAYIKKRGYRRVPVGYSANDDATIRNNLANYFACDDIFADFYGINIYEWCGQSSFNASGYKDRTEEFKDYPIPVFFSEFGCNTKRPRPFTEVEALYSPLMTSVWSGGIAYMYFEEPNQYGVVQLNNTHIAELDDFDNLAQKFQEAKPKGLTMEKFQAKVTTTKVKSCPIVNKYWQASNFLPQTPDLIKCGCMESTLRCRLNSHVKDQELQALFEYACGEIDCAPIIGNGESGVYGEFSGCGAKQKASYVINEMFESFGGTENKCDFNGLGSYHRRVSSEQDLSSLITQDGTTCAVMLRTHLSRKKQVHRDVKTIENVTDETSRNLSDSVSGGSNTKYGYSNKASQVSFYHNSSSSVLISAIFLIALIFIY